MCKDIFKKILGCKAVNREGPGAEARPGCTPNFLHVGSLEYSHCSPPCRDALFHEFLHLNNVNE
jgi:hypothetical protein